MAKVCNLTEFQFLITIHCLLQWLDLVLQYKEVIEDCIEQDKFCRSETSASSIPIETIACSSYGKILAICRREPELVTITLKKQPCDGIPDTITEICITYPSGMWLCRNLMTENHGCEDTDVTEVITTEVARGNSLNCSQETSRDADHNQVCVKYDEPTTFNVTMTVCEHCVKGRKTLRAVQEEKQVCHRKTGQICTDVATPGIWRKWCRSLYHT